MSIHLYRHQSQSPSESSSSYSTPGNLRVLAAYENGSVVLREYDRSAKEASVEGQGWDIIWKSKLHVESSTRSASLLRSEFILFLSHGDESLPYERIRVDRVC